MKLGPVFCKKKIEIDSGRNSLDHYRPLVADVLPAGEASTIIISKKILKKIEEILKSR